MLLFFTFFYHFLELNYNKILVDFWDTSQGQPWLGLDWTFWPGPSEVGPALKGQGQGQQNWTRAGPDRPVDTLSTPPKGAPGLESRTGGWLVSQARGGKKKKELPIFWAQNIGLTVPRAADRTIYGYGCTLYGLYTAISVLSSVPYASTSVTLTVWYVVWDGRKQLYGSVQLKKDWKSNNCRISTK